MKIIGYPNLFSTFFSQVTIRKYPKVQKFYSYMTCMTVTKIYCFGGHYRFIRLVMMMLDVKITKVLRNLMLFIMGCKQECQLTKMKNISTQRKEKNCPSIFER